MMRHILGLFLKTFYPLSPLASLEGRQIDLLLNLIHIQMAILFAGWAVYFVYVLWRFRKKKNPKASYHGLSNRVSIGIEVAIVLIEVLLLTCISIPFWKNFMSQVPDNKNKIEIQVVAEQFTWNMHYPNPDGKFGRMDEKFYDAEINPMGLDHNDPMAKDNFVSVNEMHVPLGKMVLIDLTAKDVIHSFTLPDMRIKRDAIPGMRVQIWFTPIRTGKFDIACSQLCGLGHYRMKGVLTVESPEQFKQWVKNHTTLYSANP